MALPKRRIIKSSERSELLRFERFSESEGGIYPATLAAIVCGLTTAGIWAASERGAILCVTIGRVRYYGRRSVRLYSEETAARANFFARRRANAKKNLDDL